MLGETKLEVGSKLKIRKSAKVMSAEAFDFISTSLSQLSVVLSLYRSLFVKSIFIQ